MTIFFCVLMGQRQIFSRLSRPLNQACNEKLLVLFSTKTYGVGMQKNRFNRPFFSAPKTNVKIDGKENIFKYYTPTFWGRMLASGLNFNTYSFSVTSIFHPCQAIH